LIKTIIFDLGKVLIPFEIRRGYAALQPHCACPPEEVPRRIAATGLVPRFEMGRLSSEQFFAEISELLELEVSYPLFCQIWGSIFLPETLIPDRLLESLRAGYRLLLLSNTNAIHFAMVRDHYPLLRHFHDYVLSFQVGALKPAPEMYQAALARAACRPQECFYTDDILEYVEAARGHGLDAVQFQSLAQLKEELRKRGVGWQDAK